MLSDLAEAHLANGDPGAARDAWQQALDILDQLGHPDADDVRNKLGRISSDPWPLLTRQGEHSGPCPEYEQPRHRKSDTQASEPSPAAARSDSAIQGNTQTLSDHVL